MASVSPSSQKVDTFLSSLSELSQERSKEDQQRQRDLQRNVDSLRHRQNSSSPTKQDSRLPIAHYEDSTPALRFSRNRRVSGDAAPELPRRRDETPPPALPRRRDESPPPILPRRHDSGQKKPPLIPKKPNDLVSKQNAFTIDLVNPVARSDSASKQNQYTHTITRSKSNVLQGEYSGPSVIKAGEKDTYRSFAEVESAITNTSKAKPDWLSSSLQKSPSSKQANFAPKPSHISAMSSAQNSKADHLASPVKPMNPVSQRYLPQDHAEATIVSATREKSRSSWIDSSFKAPSKTSQTLEVGDSLYRKLEAASKDKPGKPHPSSKPLVPTKPNFKSYKLKDEELLQAQLIKIKGNAPKTKPKPSFANFEADNSQGLKTQLQKLALSKPPVPSKPPKLESYKDKDNELLNSQINKLKSGTNAKVAAPIKPLKQKPQVAAGSSNTLSHQASAEPSLAAKSGNVSESSEPANFRDKLSSIMRASTEPRLSSQYSKANDALTNYSFITRTNSLPTTHAKRPDATQEGALVHTTKARAKGPKRRLPKALKTKDDKPTATQTIKVPPPINKLTKPRAVSGARNSTSGGSVATGSATPHIAPSFDEELFI